MRALRRYTNFSAALRILQTRKITLLSPDTWDDVNDRRLLEVYKQRGKFKSVLCLCFAEAGETYHHWKVFSPGTDGVCIVFDKEKLLDALPKVVSRKKVGYYLARELGGSDLGGDDLPFCKRHAYKDEKEFRLLWVSDSEEVQAKDFDIPICAIDRIIINPWLPSSLSDAMKEAFENIKDLRPVNIVCSTITNGPSWKRFSDRFRPEISGEE